MNARPHIDKHPVFTYVGGLFVLYRTFPIELPDGRIINLPQGSVTNFASIPWFGRWLISPIDERVVRASMAHDYLVKEFAYWHGVKIQPFIRLGISPMGHHLIDTDISWEKAAAIFKLLLKEDGLDPVRRFLMYWAVRIYRPYFKAKAWIRRKLGV